MKISGSEIASTARVITSNVILNLMNDLPGFKELVDKASRRKGYSWSTSVDQIEDAVKELLLIRLHDMTED